jgi:hypothetical protein
MTKKQWDEYVAETKKAFHRKVEDLADVIYHQKVAEEDDDLLESDLCLLEMQAEEEAYKRLKNCSK